MNDVNSKPKILVIDDTETDRVFSKMMLETKNLEVVTLASAVNCLEFIAKEKPNLILLDIMMPDMDGKQALKLIRRNYSKMEIPIVMVTSKTTDTDVVDTLKSGANDYIMKPFHFDLALNRVETQLILASQSRILMHAKEIDSLKSALSLYRNDINTPISKCLNKIGELKNKYTSENELMNLEKMLIEISNSLIKSELILEEHAAKFKEYIGI